MKATRNQLQTIIAVAAIAFGLSAARADEGGFCSTANAAGRWGFTLTGFNTTGGADAAVGSGTVDAFGKVDLKQTEVSNGKPTVGALKGHISVSRNCTATLTATLTVDGTEIVTSTWALVYVDNQSEIRGILIGLDKLPPNAALPVQTINAKRQWSGRMH